VMVFVRNVSPEAEWESYWCRLQLTYSGIIGAPPPGHGVETHFGFAALGQKAGISLTRKGVALFHP